jgi:hypothetical protein
MKETTSPEGIRHGFTIRFAMVGVLRMFTHHPMRKRSLNLEGFGAYFTNHHHLGIFGGIS